MNECASLLRFTFSISFSFTALFGAVVIGFYDSLSKFILNPLVTKAVVPICLWEERFLANRETPWLWQRVTAGMTRVLQNGTSVTNSRYISAA